VVFSESADGVKLPLPDVDHVPVVAPPETIPLRSIDVTEEHTVELFPASTMIGAVIVTVIESETGVHELYGVNVNTTVPLLMSVLPGE
jgi:hypothetical protein